MPSELMDGLVIEKIQSVCQARRSKITAEVLVVFQTSQQRDAVQSYAFNLATHNGGAGMRMDIPDFLRGLFRQFETHAINLKNKYGSVKRAIKFDDLENSLYMDVKLEDSDWHRITAQEIREVKPVAPPPPQGTSRSTAAEKKRILLINKDQPPIYRVASEDEEFYDSNQQGAPK